MMQPIQRLPLRDTNRSVFWRSRAPKRLASNFTVYQRRRDVMVAGLREIGLEVELPKATFYLWIQVPQKYTSAQFATLLLEQGGIVATPGNGFGEEGEGYIRMALTVDEPRLGEAIERLKRIQI